MKIDTQAAMMPGRSSGSVIVNIVFSQVAPQTRAHRLLLRAALSNVRNSHVVNVGAVGHTKEGIYPGHTGGAVSVRLSGCRASGNGRNGISVVEGDQVTIDHCRVEYNNLAEAVAGIDLEPDEALSVTNSKPVANTVFSQDVGIRLYVPYAGYATVADNAIDQNTASGHRGPGVFDHKTSRSVYVGSDLRGNRKELQFDSEALTGFRYADACQLPALPPPPIVPDEAESS